MVLAQFRRGASPSCHISDASVVIAMAAPAVVMSYFKGRTMASKNTAAIDSRSACLTLINVYEVEPERQAELVKALSESTERVIRHQPGFMSVSIHSSLDGSRVANYAQWESKAHFEGFMRKPETQEQLKRFADLAKSVAPSLYKVDAVYAE